MVHTCNPISEKEGRHWQIPRPYWVDNLVNYRPVRDLVSDIEVEDTRYLFLGLHTHTYMRLHIHENKHTET